METERKFHYCVLYVRVLKQAELKEVLRQALPKERGTVFYPCMECWRRGTGRMEVKAIFPGYIFIRSDMDLQELHAFIREHRGKLRTFIRELGLSEKRASGDDVFEAGEKESEKDDSDGYKLTDLTEEEAEFLDFLLDAGSGDGTEGMDHGAAGGGTDGCGEAGENEAPREGLLRMSYGYSEGGRFVVMEGPLKAYENRIANVNRHNRKAYLDFDINGCVVKAGFELKPKRYWFPEDEKAPEVLADGTEVDLRELKIKMMGG